MLNPETATPKTVVRQMELYLGLNPIPPQNTLKEWKMRILEEVGLPRKSSALEDYKVWHPDLFPEIHDALESALEDNKFAVVRLTTQKTTTSPGRLFVSQLSNLEDLPMPNESSDIIFTALDDETQTLELSNAVKAEAFIRKHAQKVKIKDREGEFNLGGGFRISLDDFETEDGKSFVRIGVDATLNDTSQRLLDQSAVPQISQKVKLEINKDGTIIFPQKEGSINLEKQLSDEDIAHLILSQVINETNGRSLAVSRLFAAMAFTYPSGGGNSIEGVYTTQEGLITGSVTDFDTADMVINITGGMIPETHNLHTDIVKGNQKRFFSKFVATPLAKLAHVPEGELNFRKETVWQTEFLQPKKESY